jgi:hypothetical protein
MESRKQGVSIRISSEDVDKIRQIARRLTVRDSDVIRYAIKSMLNRLSPLDVAGTFGKEVLPAFIENGADLAHAFDLNTAKLDLIINGSQANPADKVSRRDIELLTLSGKTDGYLRMRISEVVQQKGDSRDVAAQIQKYLYEKYMTHTET